MFLDLTRGKEARPMAKRSVRARVRAGQLEPLEGVPFPEGAEVTVTGEVPEARTPGAPRSADWPVRKLGIKEPFTRADIYDDAG